MIVGVVLTRPGINSGINSLAIEADFVILSASPRRLLPPSERLVDRIA